MSAVTYHGEYPDGQVNEEGKRYIVQHGETFVEGKSVNVTDKVALARFASNRFFKTVESDKDAVTQGQDEAEKAEVEALRAELTEAGFAPHHRLGLDKLRELKAQHETTKAKAAE